MFHKMSVGGFLLCILGAVLTIWSYEIARFREQLDVIGSKRSLFEVEPADWYVDTTRITRVIFVVAGLGAILLSLPL